MQVLCNAGNDTVTEVSSKLAVGFQILSFLRSVSSMRWNLHREHVLVDSAWGVSLEVVHV